MRGPRFAFLLSTLALAACVRDDTQLLTPRPGPGGDLFARYVALGNSITAGFQSGGINDSLQQRAYPVLLARQAGVTDFGVPSLAGDGCPPPFVQPLGPTRLNNKPSDSCELRKTPTPPLVQNLAVPGERQGDLLRFPADPSIARLHTLLIGSRTQVQAMKQARPTLVSVWIGNNDALAAALNGQTALLTPTASFTADLAQLAVELKAANPRDVILIGVVDASVGAALIQPGAYFFVVAQGSGGRFQGKPVNANCAPGTPNAANLINFQMVADPRYPEINCDPIYAPPSAPTLRGFYNLDVQEQAQVQARVAEFNQAIQQVAQANGWIYVDPNALLRQYLTQGPPYNFIRKCQMLPAAQTATELQNAVVQSCPEPTAPNFFGSLLSFDGVHPSNLAHRIVANALIDALNAKYNLGIPRLSLP
jgi:lysophospholipase L1-like esterase